MTDSGILNLKPNPLSSPLTFKHPQVAIEILWVFTGNFCLNIISFGTIKSSFSWYTIFLNYSFKNKKILLPLSFSRTFSKAVLRAFTVDSAKRRKIKY